MEIDKTMTPDWARPDDLDLMNLIKKLQAELALINGTLLDKDIQIKQLEAERSKLEQENLKYKMNHEGDHDRIVEQSKQIKQLEAERSELIEKMTELLKAFNDSDKNYADWVATKELYSAFTGVNNLLERLNSLKK